ncbi:MAG: type II toxin-antitoxin system HicB family antitoxin [Terriglobales bacterium]
MEYLVVYERSSTGWGAYAPDLPGLGVAGKTFEEVKNLIREAVEFHLEGIRQHGDPPPSPSAITEYKNIGTPLGLSSPPEIRRQCEETRQEDIQRQAGRHAHPRKH